MKINKSEIAKKTGISRVSISQIFNGSRKNPSIETLNKIAITLDCSLDELLESLKKEMSSTTAKKSNSPQTDKLHS